MAASCAQIGRTDAQSIACTLPGSTMGHTCDPQRCNGRQSHDADPSIPCASPRADPRPRGDRAALRRALERGSARARQGQAMELPARLQGRDRSARRHRSLRRRGLRHGGREPAAHASPRACSMRDANPYYYAYRAHLDRAAGRPGLACVASLDAYATNRIKKHELTTPVKETDRVAPDRGAQRPDRPRDDGLSARARDRPGARSAPPSATPTSPSRPTTTSRHELWVIGDAPSIDDFTATFEALPALYIADGHHRSAAAARVAEARGGSRRVAPLLPERDLPPSRDDDPRLQPRHPRPQRPHARAAAGRDRRTLRRHAVGVAGATRARRASSACSWAGAGIGCSCGAISCREAIRSAGCRSRCSRAT